MQKHSKSGSEAYCADFLAPAGYAVFSINYRASPQISVSVHGLRRGALRALLAHNAAHWNADLNKIALGGGSAGGFLGSAKGADARREAKQEFALSAAHWAPRPFCARFLENTVGLLSVPGNPAAPDPVDRESARPDAVATLYAQSSFATVLWNNDVHALLDPLIAKVGEPAALLQASPITYVKAGDPPSLLIQGDRDEYIPFTEDTNLQVALHRVGVRCDIIRIPGGKHGTGGWNKLPGVPDWERQMAQWLNTRFNRTSDIGPGIRLRE